jgi:hypothetical protein
MCAWPSGGGGGIAYATVVGEEACVWDAPAAAESAARGRAAPISGSAMQADFGASLAEIHSSAWAAAASGMAPCGALAPSGTPHDAIKAICGPAGMAGRNVSLPWLFGRLVMRRLLRLRLFGCTPGAEPKAQDFPEDAASRESTAAMLPWIGLKEMPSGGFIPLIFKPGGAEELDCGLPAALQQPPLALGALLRQVEALSNTCPRCAVCAAPAPQERLPVCCACRKPICGGCAGGAALGACRCAFATSLRRPLLAKRLWGLNFIILKPAATCGFSCSPRFNNWPHTAHAP